MVDDSKMLYKADDLWSKSVQLGVTSPNKIKHNRGLGERESERGQLSVGCAKYLGLVEWQTQNTQNVPSKDV